MPDVTAHVYSSSQRYRDVGQIIGGLVALKSVSEELFVILPDRLIRARSSDVRVSEVGIVVDGQDVVPFEDTTPWDCYHGNACVNFTIGGKTDGIIAPATRPDHLNAAREVQQFVDRCDRNDDIFLYDLDANVPAGTEYPDVAIDILLSVSDKKDVDDEDMLIVQGNGLPIAEMTWAESDTDGDGNHYLHVVMSDGRYRRICAGDFSR